MCGCAFWFISFRLGVRNFVFLRRRLLPLLVGPVDVAGGVCGPPDIVVALPTFVYMTQLKYIYLTNQSHATVSTS
jgi:hypothetical protein